MRSLNSVLTVLAASAAAACASSKSAPTTNDLGPALLQWSGRFQAVQQQSGNVTPRGRNNVSGTVMLTAATKSAIKANIQLTAETGSSLYLHWALISGRCGSDAVPVLTIGQFPDIAMSNGRGHVEGEVPTPLPTNGSYHVNVYWGNGGDEADVMTCANLRLEAKKAE